MRLAPASRRPALSLLLCLVLARPALAAPTPAARVRVLHDVALAEDQRRWGDGVLGLCLELRDDVDLSTPSHAGLALVGACLRPPAAPAKGEPR